MVLINENPTDCVFVVEDRKFSLHKKILASHSPVFEKTFFGAMASVDDDEILLHGVGVEEFEHMISFIYNKRIPTFTSVLDAWLTFDIADRYFVKPLMDCCLNYIEKNLRLSNLLLIYEYAELYNIGKLMKACLRDIAMYTKGVFQTSSYHIKSSTWCVILKDKMCNLDEEDLAEFVVRWAVDECNFKTLECSAKNVWKILCEVNLACIVCFLKVDKANLNNEELKLFGYLKWKVSGIKCNRFITQTTKLNYQIRSVNKIHVKFRLRDGGSLSSTVKVNETVALFGIVVSTEQRPSYALNDFYNGGFIIEIYREDSNKLLFMETVEESQLKYDALHHINFKEIVIFEPDIKYVVNVRYKNSIYKLELEVLSYYLGGINQSSINFQFFNEIISGSAVRGLSFYPV